MYPYTDTCFLLGVCVMANRAILQTLKYLTGNDKLENPQEIFITIFLFKIVHSGVLHRISTLFQSRKYIHSI